MQHKQQTFSDQFESSKTYVLAVSGGVDSVVMLDMIARINGLRLIIAHFDHQIRGLESTRDADFVRSLAKQYNLDYRIGFGKLGAHASEDQARQSRYRFLRSVARDVDGVVCTAHHQDDLIETIALNLTRGTGWRGLAVFGATDILRPLLGFTKQQLLIYARDRQLVWQDDSTNSNQRYLRNRLRQRLQAKLSPTARELLIELYQRQHQLAQTIRIECERFYQPSRRYQRYFWIMIDELAAQELLNFILKKDFNVSLTRPQLQYALIIIKTARSNDLAQLGEGIEVRFSRQEFWFKRPAG